MQQTLLKIAGDSSLFYASWDCEETVVFHHLSGDTHTLNPIATAVVRSLEEEPSNRQEFPARLADRLNYFVDDEFCAYVNEVINELYKTGLVEIIE